MQFLTSLLISEESSAPPSRAASPDPSSGSSGHGAGWRGRVRGFHDDEAGLIGLVSMVVMIFFLLLVGLVANTGRYINHKIEAQNTADAAAYSQSIEAARLMNAVTTTNHLMGEMLSFVVIHRAIGGPELESNNGKGKGTSEQGLELMLVGLATEIGVPLGHYAAKIALGIGNTLAGQSYDKWAPFAYEDCDGMDEEIKCGATVRDGKLRLKIKLFDVYRMKIGAAVLIALRYVPYIGGICYAAGTAIAAVAHVIEYAIKFEWIVLHKMESIARNSAVRKYRDVLYTWMLPNATNYSAMCLAVSGTQMGRSAASIAELNGYIGTTMSPPMLAEIPIKKEPFPGSEAQNEGSFKDYNPALLDGVIPAASLVQKGFDKAAAKKKKKDEVDKGKTEGAGEKEEKSSDEVGEYNEKVASIFQLAFYTDFFRMNSEYAVQRTPGGFMPIYFRSWRWEYDEGGLYWSQGVMATFPWVLYDRKPIIVFTSWMIFSNAQGLFRYYTNGYTIERVQYAAVRKKKPALFFVMKGSNATFKGVEPFTGWPGVAALQHASFFVSKAWTYGPGLTPISSAIYKPQLVKAGNLAYAAGELYNANDGSEASSWDPIGALLSTFGTFTDGFDPPYQSQVPYDLLNWKPPVEDSNARRYGGLCRWAAISWPLGLADATLLDGAPKIQVNWQARLHPAMNSIGDAIVGKVFMPSKISDAFERAIRLPTSLTIDPKNLGGLSLQIKPVPPLLENH